MYGHGGHLGDVTKTIFSHHKRESSCFNSHVKGSFHNDIGPHIPIKKIIMAPIFCKLE